MIERARRRRSGRTWSVVAAVALLVVVVAPVTRLIVEVLSADVPVGDVWRTLRSPVVNTLVSSFIAACLALAIGLGGAVLIDRAGGRTGLEAAMILPLLVPPFVSAISWLRAYGPTGLVDDLTGVSMPGLEGGAGVTILIAVNAAPIAFLVIRSALRTRVSAAGEAAARVSGASATRAFATITLPLVRPAIVGAFGLVFVFGVNAFGIPAVLGTPAGFATVTTRIYQDLVRSADPVAFDRVLASAALLVAIAAVVVGITDSATRRPSGTVTPTVRPRTGGSRWASVLIWAYTSIAVGFPTIALALTALTRAPGLAPIPANWTLANFETALSGTGVRSLIVSLVLGAVAATLVLALGGVTVVAGRRRDGRHLGTATILTFAVPGSALAVAVALTYGRFIREGVVIILVAYLAKFWALGHRTLAGTVERIASGPLLAARVSGADAGTAIRTVMVPLLRPAVIAGWLIVFLFGFHELTMSSLLYGPGSETLAVAILNLRQLGDAGATTALALILTAVVAAGAGLAGSVARARR